jgi:hypothetical protein
LSVFDPVAVTPAATFQADTGAARPFTNAGGMAVAGGGSSSAR